MCVFQRKTRQSLNSFDFGAGGHNLCLASFLTRAISDEYALVSPTRSDMMQLCSRQTAKSQVIADLKLCDPGVNAEAEVPLVVYRVNIPEMLKEHWPVSGAQHQGEADQGGDEGVEHV